MRNTTNLTDSEIRSVSGGIGGNFIPPFIPEVIPYIAVYIIGKVGRCLIDYLRRQSRPKA